MMRCKPLKPLVSGQQNNIIVLNPHSLKFVSTKKGAFSFYDRGKEVVLREKNMMHGFSRLQMQVERNAWQYNSNLYLLMKRVLRAGQYQNGLMNYRNHEVILLQSNTDIVNPLLLSTEGYGLLWTIILLLYSVVRRENMLSGRKWGCIRLLLLLGSTMDEIVSAYRYLTGAVPMFPKWAFGFWQSKERYKSFAELESVVNEYRRREYLSTILCKTGSIGVINPTEFVAV